METGTHRQRIRLPRFIILMAVLLCLCSIHNASSQIYSGGGDIKVNEGWGDTLTPSFTIDELSRFMYLAISKGQDKEVLKLIQQGTNINARDQQGRTFLMWASMGGHERITRILIDAGADVHAKDANGVTALMQASALGYGAIVQMLIQAGADVRATSDGHKITSLLAAAAKGHAGIVKILIDAGADINVKGAEETTPLMIASENGHDQVVRILIDAGANLDDQDEFGETPLSLASTKGHSLIVEMLKEAGARGGWVWISLLFSIILGMAMLVVMIVFSCGRKKGGYRKLFLWCGGVAACDMFANLTFGGWITYFVHEFSFRATHDRPFSFPWGVWLSFLWISMCILVGVRTDCDFKWSCGRSFAALCSILLLTLFASYHVGRFLLGWN
ncbi:ankyrin repeat domain-containing protein [Akkermansia muciniphila]|jgi:ankyrin repeat protein|nr:hypothetical protein CXT93_04570 [Akkermansia muciniphila]PND00901.1 hypothetical protein CXT87_03790 [Akkermansia muciniphila]PND03258.1 hypothetical protein CXT86_09760 [Akkermansia muciniphila]PND11243.1 hypothetical protein CXT85_01230 [Akkermansia muciniphila]QBH16984.1 ankyrin repeat domain-containing protein [Akkermansia muciniphila]